MRQANNRANLLSRSNLPLAAVTGILLVVGVLFIYSACYANEDRNVSTLYKSQLLWATVGVAGYLVLSLVDYRRLRTVAWPVYAVCMGSLVLVLLAGRSVHGAQRWLAVLPGVMIQPSEFAKMGALLLLASELARPRESLAGLKIQALVLGLLALPMLLILKQPNLSTALVFAPMALVMMFVAGVPMRNLGILALVGLACAGIVVGAVAVSERVGASTEAQDRIVRVVGLSGYHKKRIAGFLNPKRDPLGAGWNRMQSRLAVGSGRMWGKGWKKGTQNILEFLPKSVAPTDFVYAVIAEETGFAGSSALLLLFGVLLASIVATALSAADKFGRLLCMGVAAMLFCHVFVNVSMTLGLLPVAGLPLPLLSYGGSFMVVVMCSLGVVQSVHIRSRSLYEGAVRRADPNQ